MTTSIKSIRGQILQRWFGPLRESNYSNEGLKQCIGVWFGIDQSPEDKKALDEELKRNYQHHYMTMEVSISDFQQDTVENVENLLAICILYDQFPRNIYRGSKQAFEYDNFILKTVKDIVPLLPESFPKLHAIERGFIYLPYMHSEDINDQLMAEKLYQELSMEGIKEKENGNVQYNDAIVEYLNNQIGFAKSHKDIIAQFGRYPHRNKVLGRENTEEEDNYLNSKDNNSFGQ